ncbi:MAG: hypothetical protein KJO07_00520, partial [Deltaproteobacteria bacterium]|nr:hypothetical protein [Deltaproteobacteria bacterium]
HKVQIEMVADNDLEELIQEAQALDRHIDPSGDVTKLMERALRVYISERHKAKHARASKPRARDRGSTIKTKTKSIPAEIKRKAMAEAEGRCTYVASDGHRCSETSLLEFDHRQPRALGGTHESVRVLCRAHNQFAANLAFGRQYMDERRNWPGPKRPKRAEELSVVRGQSAP